jgi:hypothetical protein
MDPLIKKSRELVDTIYKSIAELAATDEQITDPAFKTDLVVLIGQHRHTFEEQGVTDHKDCITSICTGGTYSGTRGLMLYAFDVNPQFRQIFLEVVERIRQR